MMNASQIHTNDTLATSRKPAAKSALKKITPPNCKNLRILILCIFKNLKNILSVSLCLNKKVVAVTPM